MRITILGLHYAPELTGNAPYTAGLAEGLAERGHQVRVITGHPSYPEWRIREGYGQWSRREDIAGVDVLRLRHWVPKSPTAVRRLISEMTFGLRLLFRRWGSPDVVIIVSPALFGSAFAALRARIVHRSLPVALWVQDLYSLGVAETGTGGFAAAQVMRRMEAWLFKTATRVFVIHERFATTVVSELGVSADEVRVLRNWSHLELYDAVDRNEARSERGWGPRTLVLLHAGNQGMKQGLENLVATAKLAEEQGTDVRVVLLGGGNQRDRLEEMAAGTSTIEFLDALPDRAYQRAMAAADVLIVNERPGVSEMAVPSKLTSYFSTGRPVLAAVDPQGVTASEIEASMGGVVVNPGKPGELLDAALSLAADPERCADLGAAGLRYRVAVLSRGAAIERFEQALRELVTTSR